MTTVIGRRDLAALVAGLVPAFLLAGCSGLIPGTGQPPQLYVLTRKSTFSAGLPTVTAQLLVSVPVAPAEIDTARVVLRRSPFTVDYFANAAWADRAPPMVQSLLIESFEATGKIVGVGRDESGLRADYLLLPELRRFEADYTHVAGDAPPTILVRLLVRLVRMPDRTIIGLTTVERQARAARNDMAAIVEAYDDALGSVMKELVTWTLERMSADSRAAAGPNRLRR